MSNEEQEEDRQATIRQLASKGYSLGEATRILEEHPKDRIRDYLVSDGVFSYPKAQDGKPNLTLDEATKIMASLGWLEPIFEEDDPNYVEWGNTDKILYAHYDKEDRELMVQTMVYLRDEPPFDPPKPER